MTAADGALGPDARDAALETMSSAVLDLLVIGGGVVGAGTALDATTRGLSVGLIEARDFASGTSSRSSKLVHGGLRYLEMLDFRLVAEALRERSLLLNRLAPHLVRPVAFLYPLTRRGWERPYVGTGIALYDALARVLGTGPGLPRHRHLSRRAACRVAPALSPAALVGAVQYWDAQVDDARYTMMLARTAARHGAACASRVRAVALLRDGDSVVGARVEDLEFGRVFDVRARQVVNATGVWTDDTQALAGTRPQFRVRASKGVHLVVPRERLDAECGLILRTATSVLFVIPWGRHWIIGTTDTDWSLDRSHPAVSAADVGYLLTQVNRVLASRLGPADVVGVYAGLRPLLAGESEHTSRLSREHLVSSPVAGLVVVAGGKYTTYRIMARDAVDEAVRQLGATQRTCVTEHVPLVGAEGWAGLWNRRRALAVRSGLSLNSVERLLHRYGSLAHDVLALVEERPELRESLPSCAGYLQAEVVYAATHEGALHLDDVLARRTRISIESRDRGVASAPAVADLMGDALGWSSHQRSREVEHYVARVAAERDAQTQPDDATADAARLGAPDIVPLT